MNESSQRDSVPPPLPDERATEFWQLADDLRPYLRGVAVRTLGERLKGKVDASDVVQQGLAAAAGRIEQFRGGNQAELQGWLVAIVRNEALNALRFWRQERRDLGREQKMPAAGSSVGWQPAADQSNIGDRLVRRERAARLMATIERLPSDYRQVLEQRHFHGVSYADIASELGRSEAAIRQLWVRAVRLLRSELGEAL